eukprot:TRINITY_DN4405_c0_g1::TRINITY_DN4405_c0_g1_i1::g.21234::m.21234 TRINITY_DN4405_c0_g1::TRINITY_DN4405_c0_g1_i1::g.21234  ORF type:complete len:353 (+),score=40.90,sp/Q9USU9/TOA1_SCHPO/26.38/1e-15,TFIIA/PF03153.8/7.5e-49 TRINITY_DN4405_c0_g1_i1:101-1159(+)
MSNTVRNVYKQIIDDVVTKMKDEFIAEGVDENVLVDLQKTWEKMIAESANVPGFGPTDPHDHPYNNVQYDTYSTAPYPTASYLPPNQLIFTPATPQNYYIPPGMTNAPGVRPLGMPGMAMNMNMMNMNMNMGMNMATTGLALQQRPAIARTETGAVTGRPQPYLPPTDTAYSTPFEESNYMLSLVDEATGNLLPQTDGASDVQFSASSSGRNPHSTRSENNPTEPQAEGPSSSEADSTTEASLPKLDFDQLFKLIQTDGAGDDRPSKKKKLNDGSSGPGPGVPYGAQEEDITSDLDDDVENDDEESYDNILLALYEKVTRTKNKWKCSLKNGIMHINGRDYVFSSATGDFEF